MKRGKRKRIRINYKRFTFSLTIFAIMLMLTTNVSKNILAINYDKNKNYSTKEAVLDGDVDQKSKKDNRSKEMLDLHSKVKEPEELKVQENLKDVKKVDKVEKSEPVTDKVEESNKSNDYKEVFKEDLFLGDSITDSLSFYEFIDETHVVAKFGLTCKKAKDEIESIVKVNPENIFIMFGMNDILTGEDSKQFANNYAELIHSIEEELPDANIYVQSILPVDSKVRNKKPLLTNENIEKFNQALMDMAKDENIEFLNIRTILENNEDLLEPDGIHVKYKFYKLWLDYLIDN